ncbi:MAG: hypothetical protein NZ869_05945 [Thermoanaerobaculum sp.]|nr:hypothetical protein [Thermoanaerobaculum sp.]MDW7967428.1 hypothetical protein [Thermoanaerobaculum sp.]
MKKELAFVCGLVLLSSGVLLAQEQTTTLSLGYQWVTLKGSEETFRTQVDEDDGLVLDQLRLTLKEGGLYDTLHLSASGFGGSPTGTLRLTAGLRQAYLLNLTYHRGRRVFQLLDYANPLLAAGVTPGQHNASGVMDRFDLALELFPGKLIRPIFTYQYLRERSRGTTTVHLGQDEFLLGGTSFFRTQEFQAGVGLHWGFLTATVLQGWRNQDGESSFALYPGAGAGNNRRPVLGRDVTLSSFRRTAKYSSDAPYTTAVVSARLASFARLSGRYVYHDPEGDFNLAELAAGNLVAFKLERFFQGFQEAALGEAKQPNWRGEGTLELNLPAGFTLTAKYGQRHRELSGWSLVQETYLGAVNFSGAQGGDITRLLTARTGLTRDDKEAGATLQAPSLGPLNLWASFTTTQQEFTLTPDAQEIVVPGNQGGYFEREVERRAAGAALNFGPVRLSVDYRRDEADRIVVRTDVLELSRWRARAQVRLGILELAANAEEFDAENDVPSNGYEVSGKDWTAELRLNPWENLSVWGAYGEFEANTAMVIRRPEDFSLTSSLYAEDGTLKEGGLSYKLGKFVGEAGYWQLENEGSRGLSFQRAFARLEVPLPSGLGLGFEAARYKYEQASFALADYTARRYLFLVRYQN